MPYSRSYTDGMMKAVIVSFSERLRDARLSAGLSQGAVCRRAGISRAYLSDLEKGDSTRPGADVVRKLAESLDVTTDYLLLGEPGSIAGLPENQHMAVAAVSVSSTHVRANVEVLWEQLSALLPEEIPMLPGSAGAGVGEPETDSPIFPAVYRADRRRYVRVPISGECMEPDVPAGSVAILDVEREPQVRDVIVAWVDGELVCKRLTARNGTWILTPDAAGFPSLMLVSSQIKVVGVVVNVVKGKP